VRNVKRELTLTTSTDRIFVQLLDLYRVATGARLSASQMARAVLLGVAMCLPGLQREAARVGLLSLPSNGRGQEAARKAFEERIARAFVAGMRCKSERDGG
jgi:hypothetical protein